MPRPRGYALIVDGGTGQKTEFDTFTCCHCNTVIRIPVGAKSEDMGGYCTMCMENICTACADHGRCTPFEKQLEAVEARGRLLASMGL